MYHPSLKFYPTIATVYISLLKTAAIVNLADFSVKLAWSESIRTSSSMELTGRLLSLPRVKGTIQ